MEQLEMAGGGMGVPKDVKRRREVVPSVWPAEFPHLACWKIRSRYHLSLFHLESEKRINKFRNQLPKSSVLESKGKT
jgi:hypothetical protein